jgi:hypothetical protein
MVGNYELRYIADKIIRNRQVSGSTPLVGSILIQCRHRFQDAPWLGAFFLRPPNDCFLINASPPTFPPTYAVRLDSQDAYKTCGRRETRGLVHGSRLP